MTCPVIQDASSLKRKAAIAAISPGSPNRLSGCLCSNASRPRIKGYERGVSVREGAMQLTRISGESSAAKERAVGGLCIHFIFLFFREWHKP